MISTRLVELVIDTDVCLTLAKWETVSGQFGGCLMSVALAPYFREVTSFDVFDYGFGGVADFLENKHADESFDTRIRCDCCRDQIVYRHCTRVGCYQNPTAGVVRSRRPADIHKSGSNQ